MPPYGLVIMMFVGDIDLNPTESDIFARFLQLVTTDRQHAFKQPSATVLHFVFRGPQLQSSSNQRKSGRSDANTFALQDDRALAQGEYCGGPVYNI